MDLQEVRKRYPQYSDLSDEELASALHRKYYSDMAPEVFAEKIGLKAKPPRQEPSLLDQAKRQAGLTLRYGVEGLAGVPGTFISPFQRLFGGKTMNEATSGILDWMGVPKPEGAAEEVVGAVSRGIAGGGGFAKAAGAIPQAMGAGSAWVNNILAQQPLAQAVQSGIGAGASEATKQAGGGEVAQLIAGAVAPTVASTGMGMVNMAGRAGREAVRPVTRRGAEQIAADVIGNVTQDRTGALRNLDDYLAAKRAEAQGGPRVGVPGSRPTAAAVSGDYGVIGAEQLAARGPANPLFAQRQAANTQARLDEMAKLRATQDVIDTYTRRRDATAGPLRERAFDNARSDVDYIPVVERIRDLRKTAEGGSVEGRKALDFLASEVQRKIDEGRIDPRNAYELHKDINKMISGAFESENGRIRLSAGLANRAKEALTAQIESAAPGFRRYLETYNRLTKPIERLEVIAKRLGDEGLTRITNATPVVPPGGTAVYPLSQDKVRKALDNLEEVLPEKPTGLPLAPYQRDVLGRVSGDLNAEAVASRGGKQPGSDTYQNIATANFLNRVLGQNLADSGPGKTVAAPLNLLYGKTGLEGRVNELVTEAFLNPERYAELLRRARTKRAGPSLTGLLQDTERNVFGGLLGGALAQ